MAVDKSTPILIVDDYPTMLRIIRNLLRQLGFEHVEEASDGTAALKKLKERDFGLVISDWNMEPMSGLELLRAVRSEPGLEHLPFVMVTAENRPERIAMASEAGASGLVVKPFDANVLSERIALAMGG
jgi:two-component system, chemotaxis family, chemotaxis protein CheY